MHYVYHYSGECSCPCMEGWDVDSLAAVEAVVVKPVVCWEDHHHAATVYWPVDPSRVIENEAVDLLREQVKAWAHLTSV